jgi:hypothetical protein
MVPYNCIAKTRKISDSRSGADTGAAGAAAGAGLGPLGILGGFIIGSLIGRSDPVYEAYNECDYKKPKTLEEVQEEVRKEHAQKIREEIFNRKEKFNKF